MLRYPALERTHEFIVALGDFGLDCVDVLEVPSALSSNEPPPKRRLLTIRVREKLTATHLDKYIDIDISQPFLACNGKGAETNGASKHSGEVGSIEA